MPDYSVLDRDEQIRLLKSLRNLTSKGSLKWDDPSKTQESFNRKDLVIAFPRHRSIRFQDGIS